MPILSTAKQTLDRIETLLGSLSNPRDRTMLTQFRNHWRGEVMCDLDAAMAVLPEDSFFSVRGHMPAGEPFEVKGRDAHRAVYQSIIDLGLNPGGAYHDEIFAFADWGMMLETIYSCVVLGQMMGSASDLDPDGLYLLHAPMTMVCPFSPEGDMLGKRDYMAAPIGIEPCDREMVARLAGF